MESSNYGFLNSVDIEEEKSTVEIIECKQEKDISDINFLKGARFLYNVGTGDEKGNSINKLSERTQLSPSSIQKYKEAYEKAELVKIEEIGRRKVVKLTRDGKKIFRNINDIFNDPDDLQEVERDLIEFRARYLRNPSVKELSNFAREPISEDQLLKTSVEWSAEEYDEEEKEGIVEKMIVGVVIHNTSAEDYLGADPRGVTSIGFCKSKKGNFEQSYIENNSEFLEDLVVEHNGCGIFRIVLDSYSEYILEQSKYEFKIAEPEEVKADMEEMAVESKF